MNFIRNIPLAVLSLFSGLVVIWLFVRELPPDIEGAWALASFDENEDDCHIGESLSAAGFGDFLSESNQSVFISNFTGLKKVPLDGFAEFLEPYDPRNDGYAEKIRSFFVREGKRYFLVPLNDAADGKRLSNAFPGIPFEAEILGREKEYTLNFFLGGAALFAAFLLVRDKLRFALQLPLLCAFAWTGPEGLVIAGLLTGVWLLLPEIWAEIFPVSAPGAAAKTAFGGSYASARGRLAPYRVHFLFIFLSLIFSVLVCILGNLPLLAALLGFLLFFLLEIWGLKAKRRMAERIHFSAVWMLPEKIKLPVFRQPLIPFAAAALALLSMQFFFPNLELRPGEPPLIVEDFVSAEDYERHLAFQLSFSRMPLGRGGAPPGFEYYLAGDGLIASAPGTPPENGFPGSTETIPPFPLEKFSSFLVEYGEGIKAASFAPVKWVPVLLLLAICFSNFNRQGQRYGGKKKTAFFFDRGVAA